MEIQNWMKEKEVLDIVTALVSIESHKENPQREQKVAQYIYNLLSKEGIAAEYDKVEENRPNVYGRIQGEEEEVNLILTGHIDTVPGFKMKYPAFEPFVQEGFIYGRGTADMKGAIGAMLCAMIITKRAGLKLKKSLMFAGVIDEEERSKGTEQMMKKNLSAKHVLIGEPTSLEVAICHKGMEWIEVSFSGKATHGSRPKEGVNAIYAASLFCEKIRSGLVPQIEQRTTKLLGAGTINVGKIKGGNDPNIVPDHCIVEIDRRWLPTETEESIYEEISALAQAACQEIGAKFEIRSMKELTASMGNMPYGLDASDPFVKETLKITEQITGKAKSPVAFPGWSDAGLFTAQSEAKCIVLGPGAIEQAHANDEFCSIQELNQAVQIYMALIEKLCMEEAQ